MRSKKRMLFVCLVLGACSALAAGSLPSLAEGGGSGRSELNPNVRFTIEIGRLERGAKSSVCSYTLVAVANDHETELRTGSRIPIPTTTATAVQAVAEGKSAATSYSFQNIGMIAKLRTRIDEGGWIRVAGSVEATNELGRPSPDPSSPPAFSQLHQEINVRLRDGRSSRVVSIDEPGGTAYVEIKADLID